MSNNSNNMFPNQNNIHNLIDLMFNDRYTMYNFHYNSYNQFINEIIFKELEENSNIIYENINKNFIHRHKLKYENIQLKPPIDETSNDNEILFPETARIKFLTYSSRLIADVKQIHEIVNLETNEIEEKIVFEDNGVSIAKIPIMVRSNYCSTVLYKDRQNNECSYDPGCYFIIKGSEKVVMPQERIVDNKILVFLKKDSNFPNGITYSCQVNSKKLDNLNSNLQIISIKMRKDNALLITMSLLQEIPIYILFKALGIITDKQINEYIMYNEYDADINNILKYSINHYKEEIWKDDNGNINYVKTQEDAINYLIPKMKINGNRFNQTNIEIRNLQKKEYLNLILERDFLPHMGTNIYKKGIYLGLMCNKLINCLLKRIEIDDRDSIINKRIDTPGVLFGQLFRQYYKKMLTDCHKYFKKKTGLLDDVPINIISQIKHTTIEQGINSALATGTWGNSKKKGVAQMLQRLTYMQFISSLRRIITPQLETTSKIDRIRFVHNTQYGFLDPVETPEHGHNVGTMKHLSNPATITINSSTQTVIIKMILEDYLIDLIDLPPIKLKLYTKIFLNGEWIGMSNDPIRLTKILKEKRLNGEIERYVSISHKINVSEIKINTDAGRLIRPLLRVENNKLLLKEEMLHKINIKDKTNVTDIHTWNDFLMRYNDVIEYVDPEEQETLLISFWVNSVEEEYNKMIKSIKNPNIFGDPVNRYNDTVYKKYTHCEFHPSMTNGNIFCNVPFAEHNDAPRNYFNFSQAKQALGIYLSNHRHRVDLAYNLYYPQIPLVYPRASRYTGLLDLPNGENCVVAIAMYTGYNQEDSILMNQSSIERGLFRAESYRKESNEITKNPATGQDEIFTKPDKNKVAGIKDSNYEKLNSKGYVNEETVIKNNDIIIGKITPIQPGEASNKIFKDSSLVYKGGVDGTIEKVYTGIKNADGYEMYNMRIRQERKPRGGDKFSSRMGQKGTIGATLRAEDMPFTSQGIRPDIIINTCCIPSRMTIGQLLEALLSKAAALDGSVVETVPFERINAEEIGEILKAHGFNEHGLETLYCGFTGKKMEAKIFICPTYYLRLKHLVQDKIHCLDESHDVLTLDGWKPIKEITVKDKVATLDNNKLIYTNPTNVLHYPEHEGNMYYIKNAIIDLAVTANHRMLISKQDEETGNWGEYTFELAENLLGKNVMYKKDAEWDIPEYKFNNEIDMNLWLIFIGFLYNQDIKVNNKIEITLNKYEDKIYSIIDKLGYIYIIKDNKIIIEDKQLADYILTLQLDNKKLPDWVFELNKLQVQILIDNIINNQMVYETCYKTFADQIQQLCLHAGWSCYIDIMNNIFLINIIKNNVNMNINEIEQDKIIYTKCPVYCLQVSSEIFYVRRNGKTAWTGNSRARGPITLLTHQPPEGRARDGGLRFGEMERDVLIAHGIPLFLKEKFMDSSDGYIMNVCADCGLIARKIINKNIFVCDSCKTSDTHKVQLPYAFKLMMQELMAINILPRIKVDENEFNT
jgi:DNA-directed RNA polymerase II subunit RPB2